MGAPVCSGFGVKSLVSYMFERLAPAGGGILEGYKGLKTQVSGGGENGSLRMGFESFELIPTSCHSLLSGCRGI